MMRNSSPPHSSGRLLASSFLLSSGRILQLQYNKFQLEHYTKLWLLYWDDSCR